jgi:fucose permease
LGVFYGFGALFLPFTIGALVANLGIDRLVLAAAALCTLAGVFPMALAFPLAKQPQRLPIREMPAFLRLPIVRAMAILLFFLSGVEFTLGGYISTYLTRDMSLPVATASWILVGYWASMMIARAILSRIMLNADPNRVVLVCAVGAGAGSLGIALAPGPALATAFIVLTGLAIAGLFPTVLGIAGARFQDHSGTVFGMLLTIALAGGMTLPWVSGQTAEALGLRWVFALVACAFGVIAVMSRVVAAQKV